MFETYFSPHQRNIGLFIKRQASDASSDNKWQRVVQRVTTNDNEWQRVVQRVSASRIMSENKWQRVTMSGYFG